MTLLEVGRIAKSHGVRGDVLISFTTDFAEARSQPGASLVVEGRQYTVAAARPHQKYMLVTLKGVGDRNAADLLRGKTVQAEPLDDREGSDVGPNDVVFVHEVIGRQLVDQHGVEHGEVVSVIDNPASDLMELASGALVPFNFLTEVTSEVVLVDVPVGLLELHLGDDD